MSRAHLKPFLTLVWIPLLGSRGMLLAQDASSPGAAHRVQAPNDTPAGGAGVVALLSAQPSQPATRSAVLPAPEDPARLSERADGAPASLRNAKENTVAMVPAVRSGASSADLLPPPKIVSRSGSMSFSGHGQSTTLPWVGTVEWGVPEAYGADTLEHSQVSVEPWAFFEEELDKSRVLSFAPAYARVEPLPLFSVNTPTGSELQGRLLKLVRAKTYREVRRRLKSEWRSEYKDSPSMSYAEYESRLFQINNIGKDVQEQDDFNAQYEAAEVKQTFFRKKRADGESDIPLVAWGPFTLTDTGSVKFDLGTAAHTSAQDQSLSLGEQKQKPLFATKDYRIDTALNFDVDPFMASAQGDMRSAVRRVGLSIEIDWLSDVLRREIVSTEIDVETDLYGDFKGFFNIVIKAR